MFKLCESANLQLLVDLSDTFIFLSKVLSIMNN